MVDTVRKNKPQIPQQLRSNTKEPYNSLFGFREEGIMVSYCTKKGSTVVWLYSPHNDNSIDENSGEKPDIITFYNRPKGEVVFSDHTVDGIARKYKVPRAEWL